MKTVKEIEEMLIAEQTKENHSGAKGPVIELGPPSAQPWHDASISVIARVLHDLMRDAIREAAEQGASSAIRYIEDGPA